MEGIEGKTEKRKRPAAVGSCLMPNYQEKKENQEKKY
jgi:hypothetical protein